MSCILEGLVTLENIQCVTKASLKEDLSSSSAPSSKDAEAMAWSGLAGLAFAEAGHVSFLENPLFCKRKKQVIRAGACFVRPEHKDFLPPTTLPLFTKNPHGDFIAVVSSLYAASIPPVVPGIHPSAVIDGAAVVPESCFIGPGAVIGPRVILGEKCWIGPHVVLEADVVVGDFCRIKSHAFLYRTQLGHHVTIKTGARIGQRGFGFLPDFSRKEKWVDVPHLGRVIIGDYVEIGANTTIDRGNFDNTVIGSFCRIDNLVQIGHNVRIGEAVIIASQCGIAGSSEVGDYSMLGAKSGVANHVVLGPQTKLGACSGVSKSYPEGKITLMGVFPSLPVQQWWKTLARFLRTNG